MLVVSLVGLGNIPRVGFGAVPKPVPTPTPAPVGLCNDYYSCTLMPQILKTSDYLLRNKNAQGITPDSRAIKPYSEYIRLNIVTQAGGYLNLYEATGNSIYLQEAQSRLAYMANSMQLGALSGGPFDGMMGYVFLQGGQDLNNAYFKSKGIQIANECLGFPWLTLDPGLMCDMALSKAYQVTGDVKYRDKLRISVAETVDRQYTVGATNGGFPHWSQNAGPSANYTAWMIAEMYMTRTGDPTNPDLDTSILKSRPFLRSLVQPDGTIVAYPGEPDGVGSSTYSVTAAALHGLGEDVLAQRLLNYLFTKQFTGADSGSYPDGFVAPLGYWTVTSPSVLRTSLIFWDLTSIAASRKAAQCTIGAVTLCTITQTNCSSAFVQVNSCTKNYAGTDVCLNGRPTKCTNPDMVTFVPTQCTTPPGTVIEGQACNNWGTYAGIKKCVGANCTACIYNADSPPTPTCLDVEIP